MSNTQKYKKKYYCYITWAVAMVFLALIFFMSIAYHWGSWINAYIVLMATVISFATFYTGVSERGQAYTYLIVSMMDILLYSYLTKDLNVTIIVICVFCILCSFYMRIELLLWLAVWTIGLMVTHACFLDTVSFESWNGIVNFGTKMVTLALMEVFMAFYVYRMNQTEEELKSSAEKARSAERSKSDFLANMSHEIRTPMNAIVGMCELILREDISDEVRENCFNIQNSGRSLLSIINDILDFSKIESGKAELIEEPFNIGSTINDVMNMAYTRKGDKNIEIIARVDPNIPRGLIGDEVRIKQIIINLVTNAVKFTNKGCVRLKVSFSRHSYGINLNVSVKDTGIGISEENLERLFTSFQQVDTKKNRSVEGTGLGLAISKRLVSKMGGFINVSSTYGAGSEFKFVIPLRVSDDEPFISVKDADKIKIAVYLDMNKYQHPRIAKQYRFLLNEVTEKFGFSSELYKSREDLEKHILSEHFSHCIVAREEYCSDKEYFNALAKKMDVVVIQDRSNAIALPKHIKCLYKPFYALSIASVLNNERYIANLNQKNTASIRFTAPDAKVLIVDDNITNLKVAEGLMRPYNMKIITVMSGQDAINALESRDYDIVFMDHMMPEMDGVEATRLIRKMDGEYYQKVPIVALTANAVNGVKEMFIQEGFNDFIAKPIELSVLDRVIKTWLPAERIKTEKYDPEGEEVQDAPQIIDSDSFRQLINVEKALVYAGNSQENYFEVLNSYFEKGEEYKKALEDYFAQQDWHNYVIGVHALKSSSLSIGAENLSELAKTLEFAGKAGEYETIMDGHGEVIRLYGEVLSEVEKYLEINGYFAKASEEMKESVLEELKEITQEGFQEYVEQIKNACENFDEEGIVSATEELCAYSLNGIILKKYFAEVKRLAGDFEYDQALEATNKAAEEIMRVLV